MIDLKDLHFYKELILHPGRQNNDLVAENSDTYCSHNWVLYKGFTEWYYFCNKCDAKKPYEGPIE